jgi:hypothetical protein
MPTAFHPLLFTADSGSVHFLGRPLSEFTVTRAGVRIRRACLDAPRAHCWVYDLAHEQLRAAQALAQAHRGNPSPSAAAPSGVGHSRAEGAARPLDREQA